MNLEYKVVELAAILGKSHSLVSLKLNGHIQWTVDEIQKLYDCIGDDAWMIYQVSAAKYREKHTNYGAKGGKENG